MKRILVASLCALIAHFAAAARQETEKKIATDLNAGISLADGNKKTLQANLSLITEGEKAELGSFRAGLEGNYGESTVNDKTDTTIGNAKAFANARKTIGPKTFWYADSSVLYDDIARIDYRIILGPGLGAYLVKEERASLSAEAGPSYMVEQC